MEAINIMVSTYDTIDYPVKWTRKEDGVHHFYLNVVSFYSIARNSQYILAVALHSDGSCRWDILDNGDDPATMTNGEGIDKLFYEMGSY